MVKNGENGWRRKMVLNKQQLTAGMYLKFS